MALASFPDSDQPPGPAEARRAVLDRPPTPRATMPYSAGLDGLRSIAVLAVVVYHLGAGWLPGGFLGVEAFFAISGYLITALLLAELARSGEIDLWDFWRRRARRLLPALYATLIGVGLAVAALDAGGLQRFGREGLAAIGYVTNWFLIIRQESYFEAFGRPSPLGHLWSLAIEEQFYLVWPIVLLAGMRRLGRTWLLRLCLLAALASTVLLAILHDPFIDPSRVYFGTDTRASALLLGAAMAMVWRPWERRIGLRRAYRLSTAGALALVGLLGAFLMFDELGTSTYRGGFLLTSMLTLVVVAAVVTPQGWLGSVVGTETLRTIGVRSYALYLVHWPIIVFTRPGIDISAPAWLVLLLRILLIVACTELLHRAVEIPLRTGQPRLRLRAGPQWTTSAAMWSGVVAVCIAAIVSLALATSGRQQIDPGAAVALPAEQGEPAAGSDNGESITEPATVAQIPLPLGSSAAAPAGAARTAARATPDGTTGPPTADDDTSAESTWADGEQDDGLGSAVPAASGVKATPTVLLIGDSVLLGASEVLEARGWSAEVYVDAVLGRQFWHADDVVQAYRASGITPDVVVVHLGNNGAFASTHFDELMTALPPETPVVLLTAKVTKPWEQRVNDALAAGVGRWPTASLIDWATAARANPGWTASDGTHLTSSGVTAYLDLIEAAIAR